MDHRKVDVSYRDVWSVLLRHRRKSLIFAGATLAVAAAYLVVTPKRYESDAKLFLRVGRESVSLDPTATTSNTFSVSVSRQQEVNSALEAIDSRAVYAKVVDAIGAEEILAVPSQAPWVLALRNRVQQWKGLVRAQVSRLKASTPVAAEVDEKQEVRRAAIEALGRNLTFHVPKDTSVIKVSGTAASPELAQKIVDTVVAVYIDEHMRLNRTEGSETFFAEQTRLLEQKLSDATARLNELKNDKAIVSAAGELRLLETQKLDIEGQALVTERDLAVADARCRSLRTSVGQLDEMVLEQRTEGISNEAADGMRQQLYDLEIRERELLAKYDAEHPLVRAVRRQVETVRAVLEAEKGARAHSTFAVNPTWRTLQLELLNEESRLASLIGAHEALLHQRTELAQRITQLNGYAAQLATLQADVDLLQENYRSYAVKFEQARIDSAIERDRISNVNVIQQASFVPDAAGPRTTRTAAMGLLVAVFGGVVLAFACEAVDPRLKSAAEVERVLELPVLVSLPRQARQRVVV